MHAIALCQSVRPSVTSRLNWPSWFSQESTLAYPALSYNRIWVFPKKKTTSISNTVPSSQLSRFSVFFATPFDRRTCYQQYSDRRTFITLSTNCRLQHIERRVARFVCSFSALRRLIMKFSSQRATSSTICEARAVVDNTLGARNNIKRQSREIYRTLEKSRQNSRNELKGHSRSSKNTVSSQLTTVLTSILR